MRGKRGPRDMSKKTIPNLHNTLWPLMSLYTKLKWSEDGTHVNCFPVTIIGTHYTGYIGVPGCPPRISWGCRCEL